MKLAIVGSRNFNNYELLKGYIVDNYNNIDLIISGGAMGADSLAERFARENNIETRITKPDWKLYGKRAGAIRNLEIVKASDEVLAFWDGSSKGTEITINMANKNNKKVPG